MKHCLVVDDSEVIRKVARRMLEHVNITSTEAESGDDALARCRVAMPDVILVDWLMPGLAGSDLIKALRRLPEGEFPRIVYCTTVNDADDISRALASGADEVLIKPFDRTTLVHILQRTGVLEPLSFSRQDDFTGELITA